MRHTIDEAVLLVSRTRRSLYRAMTEGRLAYGLEADGRRYIDTAELLRAYGAFKATTQDVTHEMSQSVTVSADLAEVIAKAVATAVAEAMEPLRKEIEKLRLENSEQRLIEYKPERSAPMVEPPISPSVEDHQVDDKAARPHSFADLLAGMK